MEFLTQPENLMFLAVIIGVMATVYTVIVPLFSGDRLGSRMKSVALERDQIRSRERQRLASEKGPRQGAKRREPDRAVKDIVERFNLRDALADEKTVAALNQAGMRGQSPLFLFLAMRVILPIAFIILGLLYFFLIDPTERGVFQKILFSLMIGGVGFYLPVLWVYNKKSARQKDMTMALPDALDLSLICVESGMTIENSFRRVSEEIGTQSLPLAEELMITVAELSYLQERRQALENFASRTGLESVKNIVMSLVQAEKYGTPLSQALRVLSRENRDERMTKAEKKAAALPPKMTVPMMIFFLPIIFCVILGPAIITAMDRLS
ncbi:type II secretion system F family protein [Pseudahrensia aquimaris]|uniref:Type II secretion system F family protein n=1 Tax=Pseudahrensia aquimaris TaxID=744461 RepID=A0ABW3FHE4_9HYPH